MADTISIRGARTHNLQNLSLDLPHDALTVITGVSGSGKSSLAFDTLYAEGQRRYLDALSLAARQWIEQLPRAEVDWLDGLRPAVAISQQTLPALPRSTVGTMSEVFDLLRLLFARLGTPHCPHHPEVALTHQPLPAIRDRILADFANERVALVLPLPLLPEALRTAEALRAAGYTRVWHEGAFHDLDRCVGPLPAGSALTIDRLRATPDQATRLADSLEHAFSLSSGTVVVLSLDRPYEGRFDTRPACPRCGYCAALLTPTLLSFNHPAGACPTCGGLGAMPAAPAASKQTTGEALPCPDCQGARLNAAARAVRFAGWTLPQLGALPLSELAREVERWRPTWAHHPVAQPLFPLIEDRLTPLIALGVGYLTLNRSAQTLSHGERQRVRLATLLANRLAGLLFVLDEPSAGLHPRDTERVIAALHALRTAGNTLVVVSHDAALMQAADYLVELGPGAGPAGGQLIYQGDFAGLLTAATPTGRSLRTPLDLTHRRQPVTAETAVLWHHAATVHTLKGEPICYPLGRLIVVTGVSGAGKSSLLFDALLPLVRAHLARTSPPPDPRWGTLIRGNAASANLPALTASDPLPWQRVVVVDQGPIGTSSRSTPATYLGVMEPIRHLFAQTPEARARGYPAARFSFNVRGGRCEVCQGAGWREVSMQFLPPVIEPCPSCHGARFNRETLEIRYRGLTIAEVLSLSVVEALNHFDRHPAICRPLRVLDDLGLGYLPLGQPAPTLSGGEAQRLKLAVELANPTQQPTLLLLDEPTLGLHFADVAGLLTSLLALRDAGHTVIAADHHPDLMRHADWLIELGPEGGPAGGHCCYQGPPLSP